MATTKIQQGAIASDAITSATLGDDITLSGDYVKVPVGNTATRPSGASAGYIRFNTTEGTLEQYDGSAWSQMPKPPIISTLSYPGSVTAVTPDGGDVITISGSNFETGVNVFFRSSTYTATYATSVTRTNSTSLSVTTPALTAGDYDVIVEQADGTQAILTSGLTSNAAPSFSTASGSLGSIQNDAAITKITIVASEADSGDIVYTVTTGSLPTGLSLDSSADSAGTISGTPTGYSAETTVNFTITATDDENQTTTRNFSLTVLVTFYSYEIDQSLLFNDDDSDYMYRTPSSAGNRRTWTWSGWIKRGNMAGTRSLFGASPGDLFYIVSTDIIGFMLNTEGSGNFRSNLVMRDQSAWYHIVLAVDTTQATESNRVKIYLNGDLVSLSTASYPSQNYDTAINNSVSQYIGIHSNGSTGLWDGYMAEVNFIDGQALAPTDLGQTKEGVWIPKAYSGSYGTNGFYLKFVDGAINQDSSGNGNNFTTSTNLGGASVRSDSPTNNFATFNPLMGTASTYSEGNLKIQTPSGQSEPTGYGFGTMVMNSSIGGKWYWEIWCDQYNPYSSDHVFRVGIHAYNGTSGNNYHWYRGYSATPTLEYNGGTHESLSNGGIPEDTIIGVAYDADNRYLTFYQNGSQVGSQITSNIGDEDWFPHFSDGSGGNYGIAIANFGQDSSFAGNKTAQGNTDGNSIGDFYYTPPTGYLALCNANLPEDATFELSLGEKPSAHFDILTWTGNGTSGRALSGLNFTPDFVWIKLVNSTDSWHLFDTIRGATNRLLTDTTSAEGLGGNTLLSFTSDGFTVSDNGAVNGSGNSYIAYCLKAGGTKVSNTDGTITTNVSANTNAGFSIVEYTGNGVDLAELGHGLNQAPEFYIVKNRDQADDWKIGGAPHIDRAWSLSFVDNGSVSSEDSWGNQTPTATVVKLGQDLATNTSGENYIMYCFHSVEGFSKVGKIYGNGSTDGTFIHTGFKPKFYMHKRIDASEDWGLWDASRSTFNPVDDYLRPGGNYAQSANNSNVAMDFLSNGVKMRSTNEATNYSGASYLYIAFAEDPFKYGNAR